MTVLVKVIKAKREEIAAQFLPFQSLLKLVFNEEIKISLVGI